MNSTSPNHPNGGPFAIHFWLARMVVAAMLLLPIPTVMGSGLVRVPNTSLAFPPNPPVFGYATSNAYPQLNFGSPVAITSPPGETNRLFVVDKGGRIYVITNLTNPTRTIFLDLSTQVYNVSESGLLGLAFHPGYATNGYFYTFYSLITSTSQAANHLHQRLSRFQVSPSNPNAALTNSELVYLTQSDPADNHNGGDLHFGRDGYLYVSLGDGGVQYDGSHNSQRIDLNYFSAIMRIDVDKRPGNVLPNPHLAHTTNSFVPVDNPFIGLTNFNGTAVNPNNIRNEFYAVGFRNPWRFSFDARTGWLYCGDVGQDAYEEVDIVPKGANCGWAYREGLHGGPKPGIPSGLIFTDPIVEYAHGSGADRGNAVIGGVVYHGNQLSQLSGYYIYGDDVSGNIWAIRYDGKAASPPVRLTVLAGISAFGTDPSNGDVLIAEFNNGGVYRLTYNNVATGTPLPPTLADTGAFADTRSLAVASGLVPYEINVPFWSDNAIKHRWFSFPGTNLVARYSQNTNWGLPAGAIWMKHFELELTNGVPASAKRLETRFIIRNTNGVYGVTYRWGNSATNATLVPEGGLDEAFTINDGGILRTQVWHYPARTECLACHTAAGGYALGFSTAQLNTTVDYGKGPENQLLALGQAHYLDQQLPGLASVPALAPANDITSSLDWRIRSYLAANCSQCHQPGGTAPADWDARWQTPLADSGIIGGYLRDDFGDTNNRVIVPADLPHSVLYSRISLRGGTQMPPLASTVIDQNNLALVAAWVSNALPAEESFSAWQLREFGSTNATQSLQDADPDGDGNSNYFEWLSATDPKSAKSRWTPGISVTDNQVQISFHRIANRGFIVEWTDSLANGSSWHTLENPENQLRFSASDEEAMVPDTTGATRARFYRVRITEP